MSRIPLLGSLIAALALPAGAAAQQTVVPVKTAKADAMAVVEASKLSWNALELEGFAPGLMLAVVQGDPSTDGAYTVRLRFPDGYVFPAHMHPNAENLTVLSGMFVLGMGDTPKDGALKAYAPGDYLYIPGRMPHFGKVQGETVVQLHGQGPFDVILARPNATN
jgi:quercetin dioxygenase-like cupin family protein